LKLSRVTQYLFGSTAGSTQIGQFSSLAAGSPVYTSDPAVIQQLSGYLEGWYGAVLGGNSPAIQDLNAIDRLYAYQLGYLFQQGIPEYDGSTVYFQNSVFQSGGSFYVTTYGSASGITGQTPPNGTYYELLADYLETQRTVFNYAISSSTGTGFTGSTSFVNLPNLSCNIVTTGKPVTVVLNSTGTGSSYLSSGTTSSNTTVSFIQFSRNGSAIAVMEFGPEGPSSGSNAISIPPSSFSFLDTPSAGSYTYTVQGKSLSGGTLFYSNVVLVTSS
jgi:hypothetical protein